jgi:phospholipase D1/2
MAEDQHASGGAKGHQTSDGHRSLKEKVEHPFPHLRDKLKDTHLHDTKIKVTHLKNKLGKFANLVNPNHRHDEEHEQKTDEKRSRICGNHRFNSFAPERDGNMIKWYVDGRDYFWVRLYQSSV